MRGKIGIKTRYQNIWYGTRLYNNAAMKQLVSQGKFTDNQVAQFRLKVVEFHQKHGTRATLDAYGISKATIYRWRKLSGKLLSLIPRSKAPKRKRVMQTPLKIVSFIKNLREKHPRLGKEKIKPLLDEYCLKERLPTISESTIGKVIKRHQLFYAPSRRIYHNPASAWAEKKYHYKAKVKHSPKPKDFGYLEIDTIVKFIHGIKFYIFNAVDIKLKFSFAYGYSRINSRNAQDFYKKLELVYPNREWNKDCSNR